MNYITEGESVGLGPIKKEDSKLWVKWFNTLEVSQYLSTFKSIMTPENEEEYYGSAVLSLHSINLTVKEFTERAKRTYKRAGFKEAGRLRDCWMVDGKFWDDERMDILRDEFYEEHDSVIADKYLHR